MKTTMKTNENNNEDQRNNKTDNETTRQTNETTKQTNEITKQTNEITKQTNETTKQINENNKTDKQELAVGGVAVREGARAQGGHQSLRLLLAVVLHQQTSWLSTKHDHCHRVGRLDTYVVMWVSIFQSK